MKRKSEIDDDQIGRQIDDDDDNDEASIPKFALLMAGAILTFSSDTITNWDQKYLHCHYEQS